MNSNNLNKEDILNNLINSTTSGLITSVDHISALAFNANDFCTQYRKRINQAQERLLQKQKQASSISSSTNSKTSLHVDSTESIINSKNNEKTCNSSDYTVSSLVNSRRRSSFTSVISPITVINSVANSFNNTTLKKRLNSNEGEKYIYLNNITDEIKSNGDVNLDSLSTVTTSDLGKFSYHLRKHFINFSFFKFFEF